MPKVSVIVTTFNRKEYLTETIQSILNQTYQDFELIVVDNYSNYDFFGLIKSFNSERITAFQNQNNGIIAVNRNIGIKHAKGEYLSFCDDDDVWLPEKLQIQLIELSNNSIDLVYSNALVISETIPFYKTNYKPTNSLNKLLFTNHITLSSVATRNNNIHFNEDNLLTGIEDYELWIRLKICGFNFSFIQTPLIKYRVMDSSCSRLSRSKNEEKVIRLKMNLILSKSKLKVINKFILFFSLITSVTRYSLLKLLNR